MSETRRFLVAALLAAGALPLQAQTTAELRARRDSVERRFSQARAALDSAVTRARAVPNDSLILQGSIVRFDSTSLESRERRSLSRAFDDAAADLQTLFGPDGASLLAGQVWFVTISRSRTRGTPAALVLEPDTVRGRGQTSALSLPLRVPAATAQIRAQAGRRFVSAQPRIRLWIDGQFGLNDPTTTHYFAHRQLALHQSSPARRCARGNIPACRDIFTYSARARWFDATDVANWDRRTPASGVVRESLLRYAVDLNGPALLTALQSSRDSTSEPLAILADAVGQPPDELLRGWQAQLAESGAVRVRPAPKAVFAAIGWFALFGFVATRRRPS